MCNILVSFFGRDTRAAQVLNFILLMWWFVVTSLTGMGVTNLEIPCNIVDHYEDFSMVFLIGVCGSGLSFVSYYRAKQILKTFALLIGALSHAVLANAYLTEYPPLDMMMCVSTVLALYFTLAVLYVFKCEGLNGDTRQR